MLFFEWRFIIFFVIVFILYALTKRKTQNVILLIASYIFYGSWDWRFLSLILISTLIDYFCGRGIESTESARRKKLFLLISMVGNLGILGVFKYSGFFATELMRLLRVFGLQASLPVLNLILPAGISFYTFQTMSYTIDVYRGEIKAQRNFITFATFVSFFPQLVAGPIERAGNLIKQIDSDRRITAKNIAEGLRLYTWGVFKKIVIADNLAPLVDGIMASPGSHSSWELIAAGIAFAFQIYGDFSGYSDMARGIAQMMGFDLMLNFNLPYFSKGIRDFWRRWHISLSTWLRDYVYIPLGGNRKGKLRTYINLNITMLLGGLWHGAAWHYILWGAYQGIAMTIERYASDKKLGKTIAKAPGWLKIALTFPIIIVGWLIFRVEKDADVWIMLRALVTNWNSGAIAAGIARLNAKAILNAINSTLWIKVLRIIGIVVVVQFVQYRKKDLEFDLKLPTIARAILYTIILYIMLFFSAGVNPQFIYFQF